MSLDLSSFERALNELEVFFGLCEPVEGARHDGKPAQARAFEAASIQAFDYTYELCTKMLRRYLQATMPNPVKIAGMTFPDLLRTGYGQGVVKSEWRTWSRLRDMRAATSHSYDPKQAAIVLAALPEFIAEARYLLSKMQAEPAP